MSRRSKSTSGKPAAENPSAGAAPRPPRRLGRWLALFGVFVAVSMLTAALFADWWIALSPDAEATYVGRDSCIKCHAKQAELFTGSHHDLAMELATEETVLGDFADAELEHHGITSKMYREGERFMIRTEGPDGEPADFEIKYVFGHTPLQQYMVEFDRTPEMPENEIARLQVLRVSWDTEKKRWFYLQPPDVEGRLDPQDDLHWTGITQRWNAVCADCHSTNLKTNFDPQSLAYHTTYSEIDVSCEACHGPGSLHIELAEANSLFWDRNHGYGLARLKGEDSHKQIETCAACHSRRRVLQVHPWAGEPYYDHFANELLRPQTYFADGQIQDEVYVYGSFIQSKMYHEGIRCTDCHDPHSARLIHSGNTVCTSCHQHPAGKYDTPAHHHHTPGSPGSRCVDCHMPEVTYMMVDPRRDHSFRVPRPDQSVTLGTPNACTGCHLKPENVPAAELAGVEQYIDWIRAARGRDGVRTELDRVNRWALEHTREWYGELKEDHRQFAGAVHAAWSGDPRAAARLAEVIENPRVSGMGRATALTEFGLVAEPQAIEPAVRALGDKDPQVRAAAVAALQILPADRLVKLLPPLLDDPSRWVRIEAARMLAQIPGQLLTGPQRNRRAEVLKELETSLMTSSDRAGAHMALGGVYEALGDFDRALSAYRTAIRVEPNFTGARTNLAALLEGLAEQQNRLAEQAARGGDMTTARKHVDRLVDYQEEAEQARKDEMPLLARDVQQAPALLERDPRLAPDIAALYYRYGMALYLQDQTKEAEESLLEAARLAPESPQILMGLALFYERFQRWEEAEEFARRLTAAAPENRDFALIRRRIENRTGSR